jgi:Ca2+-binding RTX toxin-like protein
MQEDWSYEVTSTTPFSAVTVTGAFDANDNTFKLGAMTIVAGQAAQPIPLAFDLTGTDADGDSVPSTLDVTMLPDNGEGQVGTNGAETLTGDGDANFLAGLAGNDTLLGLGGDDILVGGFGNDVLTGGAGKDTFVMTAGGGVDTVTDYVLADDSVDLSSLLDEALITGLSQGPLASFVKLIDNGGGTQALQVDTNGNTGGANFSTVAIFSPGAPTTVHILYDSADADILQTP